MGVLDSTVLGSLKKLSNKFFQDVILIDDVLPAKISRHVPDVWSFFGGYHSRGVDR